MIRQVTGPVLLLVRDVEPDEGNPWSGAEVVDMLEHRFRGDPDVEVRLIPDIASLNYGRSVGYDVREWEPPLGIDQISASEIRGMVVDGIERWRRFVHPSLWRKVEDRLR